MRRKNPFLAKPKYLGQSARLKSWEGGFHTAKTFDFAVPYAQLKAKNSLAWAFGIEDYIQDGPENDPYTVIVYGHIPPKYLRLLD